MSTDGQNFDEQNKIKRAFLFSQNNVESSVKGKTASEIDDLESETKLKWDNEKKYLAVVDKIVDTSVEQLNSQNENKTKLRDKFFPLFKGLIIAQLVFIIVLTLLQGFCFTCFEIDPTVLVAVIASVFVETLGVIGVMIKFSFDSKQEVNILQILNGVVEHFQKIQSERINSEKTDPNKLDQDKK